MAKQFDAATDQGLRANAAFKSGKVPANALNAMLNSIREQQGIERGGLFAGPKEYSTTVAQTSTAATLKNSAARVYGFRAVSPAGAANDVVVYVQDNGVNIACGKVTAKEACEVYVYGKDGIGCLALTSVQVKACAISDGSSNPSSGDRPAITVLAS